MRNLIVLLLISLLFVACATEQTDSPNIDLTTEPTVTEAENPTPTPIPTPTPEPDPFEGMTTYSSGQYKVGIDIPSDEYVIFATSDSGYFSVTADPNGDDIVLNDNFDANSIATVYEGEYLELSRAFAVSSEDFYESHTILSDVPGIMLKVGYDIEPGEYKLVATNDSGYYCVYADSRHDDIVSNDNFEGFSYVSVSEGEYLILSRCVISQ